MAIEIINVGGLDYPVQDQQSMARANQAVNSLAWRPHFHAIMGNEERGDYYSYARTMYSPFIWYTSAYASEGNEHYPKNGCLMMTTQAVSKNTQILRGVNCVQITAMEQMAQIRMDRQGNTIYMVDWTGRSINQGQFAITDVDNLYTKNNKFLKTHNVVRDNFNSVQLEVGQTRDDYYNQGGRAAIAFHNHNINAVQIYLDGNGDLQYLKDDGTARRIVLETA